MDFFRAYSSRGRYWPRDIRGRHFVRRELTELTRLVEDGKRLVLVEGEPGAGKTCLLLDMLDALERRSEPGVIFLQTRDFGSADFDGLGDVFFGQPGPVGGTPSRSPAGRLSGRAVHRPGAPRPERVFGPVASGLTVAECDRGGGLSLL